MGHRQVRVLPGVSPPTHGHGPMEVGALVTVTQTHTKHIDILRTSYRVRTGKFVLVRTGKMYRRTS